MAFMRTWFIDHILGTDQRFSQWLAATDQLQAVGLGAVTGLTMTRLRCS
jgi:hemerythrin